MSDTDLIERIATAFAERIRPVVSQKQPVVPLDVALWDVEAIAAYLLRSPKVVRERVVTLPDFPKPIRIPSTQSGKADELTKALPRWKASEVIQWTESYREKPVGRPRKAA